MVIAAVRNEHDFESALKSDVKIIFHLVPNIMTLDYCIKSAHNCRKKLFIHLDLAEGIAKDKYGIKYVKSAGVDGIISTRANVIKFAKEEELFSVQRFFILDTRSVEAIEDSVKASKADMIELMPGVVPKITKKLKEKIQVPIIVGGLVDSKEEVEQAVRSGAYAVSTGNQKLW